MNVSVLVTVTEKVHGNCWLPSPLLGPLNNDPRFNPFQNFLRKVQSFFLRTHFTLHTMLSLVHESLACSFLISLIYILLPPMKGRCSKCLMHMCLHVLCKMCVAVFRVYILNLRQCNWIIYLFCFFFFFTQPFVL